VLQRVKVRHGNFATATENIKLPAIERREENQKN
jgi:hypothetical protein